MSFETSTRKGGSAAHTLGMMNYALLFASIFFAGAPGLIAVVIAYAQRDEAPPILASHYGFQIRIFWVAFGLSLATGLCFLAVLVKSLGELIAAPDGLHAVTLDLSRLTIDRTMVGLTVAALASMFLATLWLVVAPAFGAIRLASDQGIGHRPAP